MLDQLTAIKSLSDISGDNLSDFMQLPLEPQQALNYFFAYVVVLPNTCTPLSYGILVELPFSLDE